MAETMIERVEQAIRLSMHHSDDTDPGCVRRYARAALKAMREPTNVMVEAADDATPVEDNMPWGEIFPIWWFAAIDAALSEGGE